MQNSELFIAGKHKELGEKVKDYINSQSDFLSERTISSTRAVGDAIQNLLEEHFPLILGESIKDYSADFARRAMADLAFNDREGNYYVIDVKTHRLDTKFNMPNLTSVQRLARFYEDDKNYFVVLAVAYSVAELQIKVERVHFVPIEFLSWDCLTIGALGWGQIQIANSNIITINENIGRKKWVLQLCDTLFEFYPKEIGKIGERLEYFKKVRDRWLEKED